MGWERILAPRSWRVFYPIAMSRVIRKYRGTRGRVSDRAERRNSLAASRPKRWRASGGSPQPRLDWRSGAGAWPLPWHHHLCRQPQSRASDVDKYEYTGALHSVTMLAMFWRHVMLALSSADVVLKPTLDRAGRIARGLQAEVEIFSSVYEPDIVQPLESRELLEGRIAARVDEQHRQLERLADQLRDQGLKVRASVRWDYPMFEGVVRQVLRHRPDLLIVPAVRTSDEMPRTLAYREAR